MNFLCGCEENIDWFPPGGGTSKLDLKNLQVKTSVLQYGQFLTSWS